jgi:CHASE2 domain-containing sensor protein
MWDTFQHWFLGLGTKYGVNPIVFGSIYVGAIPLFMLSIAWLIRNRRRKKSVVLPVLAASCCFVSAYVYLILAGKNIPVWVYLFLAAMVVYGTVSTIKKVRQGARTPER